MVSVEQAVAAPLCTKHLRELGADVIRADGQSGDHVSAVGIADGDALDAALEMTRRNGGARNDAAG